MQVIEVGCFVWADLIINFITLDLLSTYGITKDSLIVQGGTVSGAMLLGYLFARKSMQCRGGIKDIVDFT